MIRKRDIETYFDKEYEEQKKQYDMLMREELSERVRRRKAVDGLNFVELGGMSKAAANRSVSKSPTKSYQSWSIITL